MFTDQDKKLIKEAIRELILEDSTIAKIVADENQSFANSNSQLKSDADLKREKLISIINDDFIKYDEVFKALA